MLSNADTIPIECNRKDISIVRTATDIEIKTLAKQLKTMNAKLGRFLFLYFVPFHSCFSSSFPFLLLLSLLFRMFCTNNTLNMVRIHRVTCAEAKFLMQCVIFLPHTAQFWRFNEQISTTPAMINDSLVFVWPYTKFAHRILCAPCRNYSLERDSNVKISNDTCVIMIMIVRNQEHTHTLDSHFISISPSQLKPNTASNSQLFVLQPSFSLHTVNVWHFIEFRATSMEFVHQSLWNVRFNDGMMLPHLLTHYCNQIQYEHRINKQTSWNQE